MTWARALPASAAYSPAGSAESRPADAEPYEKKIVVLRKLDREPDVLPALKNGTHAIGGQSGVKAMLPGTAGRDRIGRIAPLVILVCEASKLVRTRAGL